MIIQCGNGGTAMSRGNHVSQKSGGGGNATLIKKSATAANDTRSLDQVVSDLKAYEKTEEYKKSGAGGSIDRLIYLANSKDSESVVRNFNDAYAKVGSRYTGASQSQTAKAADTIFSKTIPNLSAIEREGILRDNKRLYNDSSSPPKAPNPVLQKYYKQQRELYKKIAEKDPFF